MANDQDAKDKIDHDRLFKELLETFFTEFMELFFPEASRAIDLQHVTFLEQEVFTDITGGDKHIIDILVETHLKKKRGLILVHVEPQAYVQKNFNQRMFVYFSRLYEKYRRKILPIMIFSCDKIRDEPDSFGINFDFFDVLRFSFYKLELKKLNWRDFIRSDNPVAAAMLSKMGFSKEEKTQVRLEFMRMLLRMKLGPARMELLATFFYAYLKMNRQEEERFQQELGNIDEKEASAIMQMTTPWHEKGRAEGKREGRIEGKFEGKIEAAKNMLLLGLDVDTVIKVTGIGRDKIEDLKKQLEH